MFVHSLEIDCFKQQLGCRFDIMDCKSSFCFVFWIMQLYMSQYIIRFFVFSFTFEIVFFIFLSSTPVLTVSVDVIFILSINKPYELLCGCYVVWPFQFVAVSICRPFGLWPFCFVASAVRGCFGLWPSWSVALLVCGDSSLWSFSVCGRLGCVPFWV